MRVLGIESSCDETAAAVVTDAGDVLSNVVASQVATHAPYGGVVPELASRAHLLSIVPVVRGALREAALDPPEIDAIAVTQGPGLVGALLTGMSVAQAMAWAWERPLLGVDHLVGHLFAVYLRSTDAPAQARPAMPYIALLVSGGHTALYEVRGPHAITILGQTRDDAAGEAYDKVGKLLGLGYPGGPVVDRLAHRGDASRFELPTPMAHGRNFDFSFSGLKTAVNRQVKARGGRLTEPEQADLCAAFQRSVVSVLVKKSLRACRARGVPRLVLGGGVAANRGLRAEAERQAKKHNVEVFLPPPHFATDNAAMIAYAGALRAADGGGPAADHAPLRPYSRSPDVRRGKF